MPMVGQALLWYVLLAAGGLIGHALLRRWGASRGAAWGVGRVVGWTLAAYVGWVAGCIGVRQWWWVALAACAGLAVVARPRFGRAELRDARDVELVGIVTFLAVAVLRVPMMQVTGTEKPMDLAILATLMRPGGFPPGDPWLAGATLPYYYWGFLPWVPPARAMGLQPDEAFNLLVPTIAAVAAQAAWALARALGGSRRASVMAAFLVVFAGTPDGWRQLLAGSSLTSMDLWQSSREIAGAITEFPLFTFHLGDLHPHLLVVPLLLTGIFLARGLGGRQSGSRVPLVVAGLMFGAAAAANPWSALPLGAAILLVAIASDQGFTLPLGEGVSVWLRVVLVGMLGVVLFIPFWLAYRPPAIGLGWVTTPTRWDELALFMGGVLLPVVVVAWALSWRLGGLDPARRQLWRAAWIGAIAMGASLTGRASLALAVGLAVVLGIGVVGGARRRARPAWALTLVPLGLLALMELLYVRDPYGGELYRMNTVFKASHVAFTLLCVTVPLLLSWLRQRRPAIATATAVIALAMCLPQLTALAMRVRGPLPDDWGGLDWMAAGEADAARWLRRLPPGSVLVEGVGDAYSDSARLSAASGVPAVLGWENHERVWRWGSESGELALRKARIEELYRCGEPSRVGELARELGATHVAVGSVERRLYPLAALSSVLRAGPAVFSSAGCTIVQVHD